MNRDQGRRIEPYSHFRSRKDDGLRGETHAVRP